MQARFDDLPAAVRERFIRLTKAGTTDPVVVMAAPGGSTGGLSVILLIVSGLLSAALFSHLTSDSRTPKEYMPAWLLMTLAMTVAIASLLALVFRAIWKGAPYREGHYAFPGALVRTQGAMLEITPTSQMAQPRVVHVRVNGRYARSRVEIGALHFPYFSQEQANAAGDRILAARQAYAHAWAQGNAQALGPLDPFFECTTSNQWSQPAPGGPRVAAPPIAAQAGRWLAAIAIAVGVAYVAGSIQIDEDEARIKAYKKKEAAEKKKKAAADDD